MPPSDVNSFHVSQIGLSWAGESRISATKEFRMTYRRIFSVAALAGSLMLAAGGTQAQAGFVPVLISPTGTTSSTVFVYNLIFSTGPTAAETLQTGDFLTLYDFNAGVTTVATQIVLGGASGLTATVQNVGITPPGGLVNPTDNSGISNITFTYGGPTLTANTTFTATITTTGGPYIATRLGQYTSTDTLTTIGDNQQIGPVNLPTLAIPEPASVVMLGLGIVGVAGIGHLRSRKAKV